MSVILCRCFFLLFYFLFMFRYDFFDSAHVWLQCFRNIYASVCIQVVLQECDQHSRRSNYGVVQRMSEIFTVFTVYTDFQSSGLCITQVRAASYFEVFLLSWRPCFYVDRFHFQVSQVTGAAFQSTNRNIQSTEQFYGVSNWWIRYTPLSSRPCAPFSFLKQGE